MRKLNEKLAGELIDNIQAAIDNCNTLAITTGDTDFMMLALFLKAGLTAKAKGDISEVMESVAGVIDKLVMAGKDATADVLDDPRFTPSRN